MNIYFQAKVESLEIQKKLLNDRGIDEYSSHLEGDDRSETVQYHQNYQKIYKRGKKLKKKRRTAGLLMGVDNDQPIIWGYRVKLWYVVSVGKS